MLSVHLHRGAKRLGNALVAFLQVGPRRIVEGGLLVAERTLNAFVDLAQMHAGQAARVRRRGAGAAAEQDREAAAATAAGPRSKHETGQFLDVLPLQVAADDR